MKPYLWCGLLCLALLGCTHHYDDAGNYKDYALTPAQAHVVAADMVAFLQSRFPARTLFSFPHADTDFSRALESEIRRTGMGVSVAPLARAPQLRYKIERLNDTQFISLFTVDDAHFSKLWVEQEQTLLPLYTITVFGGRDD